VSHNLAGVIAQRIYFAAYPQKIGGSGSTFFYDAISECFSAHATDKSTTFTIEVGILGYRSCPGKFWPAPQLGTKH
jgi:hypothetical protein